jgi:hypothetical protein
MVLRNSLFRAYVAEYPQLLLVVSTHVFFLPASPVETVHIFDCLETRERYLCVSDGRVDPFCDEMNTIGKGTNPVIHPKDALLNGVHILESVLLPKGFQFHFRGEGQGSGGDFAWGEFVRADRGLELHFRRSLGLVRYREGDHSASHEAYMRELGVWGHCRYPGFSEDVEAPFHGLAHDLGFAEEFLSGSAAALRRAAVKEALNVAKHDEELMSGYVGDADRLEQLRTRFHEGSYSDVVALADKLNYPERMTDPQRRMVETARRKTGK